jgi:hypothetical protein
MALMALMALMASRRLREKRYATAVGDAIPNHLPLQLYVKYDLLPYLLKTRTSN